MGLVHTSVAIGTGPGRLLEATFLADTGSFYTAIPHALRERLALPAGLPSQTIIADGSVIETELTIAHVRINGRETAVPVEIVDVPEPLLGVSTLEALGLKVNPVTRALEIDRPYEHPPTVTRFRNLDSRDA